MRHQRGCDHCVTLAFLVCQFIQASSLEVQLILDEGRPHSSKAGEALENLYFTC